MNSIKPRSRVVVSLGAEFQTGTYIGPVHNSSEFAYYVRLDNTGNIIPLFDYDLLWVPKSPNEVQPLAYETVWAKAAQRICICGHPLAKHDGSNPPRCCVGFFNEVLQKSLCKCLHFRPSWLKCSKCPHLAHNSVCFEDICDSAGIRQHGCGCEGT